MSDVYSMGLPCSDCGERRHDLEAIGQHVVDCREDPTLPGWCILRYTRMARAAPAAPEWLTATQAQAAKAIINLFETGSVRGHYGAVAVLPGDTGRLTFGRSQASLGSGNLHLLVERYCGTVGARFGARRKPGFDLVARKTVDRLGAHCSLTLTVPKIVRPGAIAA